ncbi:MAG TPA: hypothetical protein VKP30_22330, partial [Polyangiaceae bacterium]|nr:hypothetical protein [Polyangiaceae bacterium]
KPPTRALLKTPTRSTREFGAPPVPNSSQFSVSSSRGHELQKAIDARSAPSTDTRGRLVVYAKRSSIQGRPEGAARSSKLLLEVRLETSPQLLQQMSDFVGAYSKYRFQPRTAERIALASYELVENAVSYGSVSGDVVFSLLESDHFVEIQVTNDASAGRLTNLRTKLELLRTDAEKVFQDEMGKSMTGSGGRAALGLARVCHEGQMDLEFEVEGNRVTMRAKCAR